MNRNIKTLAAAVCLMTATAANAQSLFRVPEGTYDHIREAVTPAVRVIKSTYDVCTTNYETRMVPEGDSVFNNVFSIAVALDGGLVTSINAWKPWAADAYFNEFRTNADFTPMIHSTEASALGDNPVYLTVIRNEDFIDEPLPGDEAIFIPTVGTDDNHFLPVVAPQGNTLGFMVWLYQRPNTDIARNANLKSLIEAKKYDFGNGRQPVKVPSPTLANGELLGGFFVKPLVIKPGVVEFALAAIATPNIDRPDEWWLIPTDIPQEVLGHDSSQQTSAADTAAAALSASPEVTDADDPDSDL